MADTIRKTEDMIRGFLDTGSIQIYDSFPQETKARLARVLPLWEHTYPAIKDDVAKNGMSISMDKDAEGNDITYFNIGNIRAFQVQDGRFLLTLDYRDILKGNLPHEEEVKPHANGEKNSITFTMNDSEPADLPSPKFHGDVMENKTKIGEWQQFIDGYVDLMSTDKKMLGSVKARIDGDGVTLQGTPMSALDKEASLSDIFHDENIRKAAIFKSGDMASLTTNDFSDKNTEFMQWFTNSVMSNPAHPYVENVLSSAEDLKVDAPTEESLGKASQAFREAVRAANKAYADTYPGLMEELIDTEKIEKALETNRQMAEKSDQPEAENKTGEKNRVEKSNNQTPNENREDGQVHNESSLYGDNFFTDPSYQTYIDQMAADMDAEQKDTPKLDEEAVQHELDQKAKNEAKRIIPKKTYKTEKLSEIEAEEIRGRHQYGIKGFGEGETNGTIVDRATNEPVGEWYRPDQNSNKINVYDKKHFILGSVTMNKDGKSYSDIKNVLNTDVSKSTLYRMMQDPFNHDAAEILAGNFENVDPRMLEAPRRDEPETPLRKWLMDGLRDHTIDTKEVIRKMEIHERYLKIAARAHSTELRNCAAVKAVLNRALREVGQREAFRQDDIRDGLRRTETIGDENGPENYTDDMAWQQLAEQAPEEQRLYEEKYGHAGSSQTTKKQEEKGDISANSAKQHVEAETDSKSRTDSIANSKKTINHKEVSTMAETAMSKGAEEVLKKAQVNIAQEDLKETNEKVTDIIRQVNELSEKMKAQNVDPAVVEDYNKKVAEQTKILEQAAAQKAALETAKKELRDFYVQSGVEKASSVAKETGGAVKETATNMVNKAGDAVKETVGAAGGAVKETVSKAADGVQKAYDEANQSIEDAKTSVKGLFKSAKNGLINLRDNAAAALTVKGARLSLNTDKSKLLADTSLTAGYTKIKEWQVKHLAEKSEKLQNSLGKVTNLVYAVRRFDNLVQGRDINAPSKLGQGILNRYQAKLEKTEQKAFDAYDKVSGKISDLDNRKNELEAKQNEIGEGTLGKNWNYNKFEAPINEGMHSSLQNMNPVIEAMKKRQEERAEAAKEDKGPKAPTARTPQQDEKEAKKVVEELAKGNIQTSPKTGKDIPVVE